MLPRLVLINLVAVTSASLKERVDYEKPSLLIFLIAKAAQAAISPDPLEIMIIISA